MKLNLQMKEFNLLGILDEDGGDIHSVVFHFCLNWFSLVASRYRYRPVGMSNQSRDPRN